MIRADRRDRAISTVLCMALLWLSLLARVDMLAKLGPEVPGLHCGEGASDVA